MDVADEFGISKTQVCSIRKRKCALIGSVPLYAKVRSSKCTLIGSVPLYAKVRSSKCALIGSVPLYAKVRSSKSKYPAIDRAVYEWFRSIRTLSGTRKPLPVSRAMIKARALFEAKRQGVAEFSASDGWFCKWRWRCNVSKSARLHGERQT